MKSSLSRAADVWDVFRGLFTNAAFFRKSTGDGSPCPVDVYRPFFHPIVWLLALFALLLHLAFNAQYGYFRDELYYAACGQHLAWGYVDHAPLAPFLARVSRWLLGDSLRALRLLPALSASAKVLLAAWLVRELHGGKFAQILASVAVLLAPIYLTFDNFFSMNAFEPVFWMAAAGIILHIWNGGDQRLWLPFGVVVGLGILNKHSMLFFASGLLLGLLLTPARRELASRWAWLGILIAALIFLPNLLWEIRNHFPTIALLRAVSGTKYTTISPWNYILEQTLLTDPLSTPIWIGGLWFLLRDAAGKKYALLAVAYLTVLAEMLTLHGKIYYLAPAYSMLFAAGAVWIEMRVALLRRSRWLSLIVLPLVAGGALALPLAVPVLPVEAAIKYNRFWDVQAVRVENVPQGDLPQLFGDMMGWQQQVGAVANVYNGLPTQDRQVAAILAYNYGEASAIDYFGKEYGLPGAISGHNQYGLWGPRGYSGEVVVAIGFSQAQLLRYFGEVKPAVAISPAYAMPEESRLTIYVCRQPKAPLREFWGQLTYYN
jgi:4-amino-4-deoxy-L-arabinose transferase-like glycosyltransferase